MPRFHWQNGRPVACLNCQKGLQARRKMYRLIGLGSCGKSPHQRDSPVARKKILKLFFLIGICCSFREYSVNSLPCTPCTHVLRLYIGLATSGLKQKVGRGTCYTVAPSLSSPLLARYDFLKVTNLIS